MRLAIFLACMIVCVGVRAQGISSARDGNGNLVERGAATRTYPSVPMANANNAAVRTTPQGYVIVARHRTVIIRTRR
jgi:hypothetical protein